MRAYSIAIDGPAGAGKSTIAKALAKKRNLIYVDTGAMYRAMALYFVRNNICPEETKRLEDACPEIEVSIAYENGEQTVFLNGENVSALIRTPEIGNMASAISVNGKIREKLVELQRDLARNQSVVMDGRDIGTCVLPDAAVKIYLTASVEVRAERRYAELCKKGEICQFEQLKQEITERDRRDMNRAISPLRKAEDAVELDTSELTVEQVVEVMNRIVEERLS